MTDQKGYQLLDSGQGRKLERIGPYCLIRPAGQAVWQPRLPAAMWKKADAEFKRDRSGDGQWVTYHKRLPAEWTIALQSLTMVIKLTDFGHLGIFPEHHRNEALREAIKAQRAAGKPFRLLNLFAYTGALSLLAAEWGAEVVHLDASKTSVAWARQNAEASRRADLPVRWIVDDVKKFVARELRRGANYQGIILDPPSYGRGAKGEVWKIEDDLTGLLEQLAALRADDFAFWQLSAHSPGFTPLALENLLRDAVGQQKGHYESFEMTVTEEGGRPFPSGACCLYQAATGSRRAPAASPKVPTAKEGPVENN